MEAVAALGLAANIIQFISFSHELLSSAKEIWSTATGTTHEVAHLRLLVANIQNSSKDATNAILLDVSQDKQSLRKIALECQNLADALIKKLSKLEAKRKGMARKFEAIAISGRSWWAGDEILAMKRRLFELEARLRQWWELETQRQRHSALAMKIDSLEHMMQRAEANSPRGQLTSLSMNVTRGLQELSTQVSAHEAILLRQESKARAIGTQDLETAKDSIVASHVSALKDTLAALEALSAGLKKAERQETLIQSLLFPFLKKRHDEIPKAHQETFEWLFDSQRTGFKQWLETGQGVYWVNGLAGSGKSTLMKFVSDHPQTRECLRSWASPLRLKSAAHYFWNSGTEMQRSQQGLMQTLLYSLLRTSPSLIDTICPDRPPGDPWDMEELRAVFVRLSTETNIDAKFCFFIDGLDEYEGAEEDIIQIVRELAASKHIKICVSSRPWPAFLSEWNESDNTLKVQDFTKSDMDKYIHDLLVENKRFAAMSNIDARYLDLIPMVSARAEGVWLWVFLVVRDLLRDMRDHEPYSQLLVRLNSYPQELEKYFENIMDRIDKVYRVDSAHIFLLVLSAVWPLSILALTHLSSWDDGNFALEAEMQPADPSEIATIHKEWVPRLQNRCRDLLRITCDPTESPVLRYQVGYLHRTVRDFLTDEHQPRMLQRAQKGFDVHIYLSRLMLLLLKRLNFKFNGLGGQANSFLVFGFDHGNHSVLRFLLMELMHHAWHIEQYPSDRYAAAEQVALLDELDRTLTSMAKSATPKERENVYASWEHPPALLAMAVQADLYLYVRHKLEESPRRIHRATYSLLRGALMGRSHGRWLSQELELFHGRKSIPPLDKRMVELLLDFGADPNERAQIHRDESCWEMFVQDVFIEFRMQETSELALAIMKLLLARGADPTIEGLSRLADTLPPRLASVLTAELKSAVERLPATTTGGDTGGLFTRLLGWVKP